MYVTINIHAKHNRTRRTNEAAKVMKTKFGYRKTVIGSSFQSNLYSQPLFFPLWPLHFNCLLPVSLFSFWRVPLLKKADFFPRCCYLSALTGENWAPGTIPNQNDM